MGKRFWEIDFLRGIAIIMMIIYHALFDLWFFGIYTVNVETGLWSLFAMVTASMFIFLSGISLTISCSRNHDTRKHLFRGAKIFLFGLVATVATWLFLGEGFVIFGILHFIGLSIIIGYFLVRFRFINMILGAVVILAGLFLQAVSFSFPWLLWLGFRPQGFVTVDYFPLLPWFGLFLIGIAIGNWFYTRGTRRFSLLDLSNSSLVKPLSFLGRHSLIIYLLHQIVIVAIITIAF